MEYLLGATTALFGIWALIATVRNGGYNTDNTRLRGDNDRLTSALDTQTVEYVDFKKKAQLRIKLLMDELEEAEDRQHAEIAKIEDPEKRRRRRRAFVADVLDDGLLSETAASASSAGEEGVPEKEVPGAEENGEDS